VASVSKARLEGKAVSGGGGPKGMGIEASRPMPRPTTMQRRTLVVIRHHSSS
jgi:hypothetical protein